MAQLDTVAGLDSDRNSRGRGASAAPSFTSLNGTLVNQLNAQDLGDMSPTAAALAAWGKSCRELAAVLAAWDRVRSDIGTLNTMMRGRGKAALEVRKLSTRLPPCA